MTATNEHQKNIIASLEIVNYMLLKIQIRLEVTLYINYYHQILGIPGIKYPHLDKDFWIQDELITPTQNLLLVKPFSEEEIRISISSYESNKALGRHVNLHIVYCTFNYSV